MEKKQLGTQSRMKLTSDGSIVDFDNLLNNVCMSFYEEIYLQSRRIIVYIHHSNIYNCLNIKGPGDILIIFNFHS
jgi:hypothetical protein